MRWRPGMNVIIGLMDIAENRGSIYQRFIVLASRLADSPNVDRE
jgi:hypothetical protein